MAVERAAHKIVERGGTIVRYLLFIFVALSAAGQTADEIEGRKRVRELLTRTYFRCGANDFRLVEDGSGPGNSQQFKIVEYRSLSHMNNIQESAPENTKAVQYRSVLGHSCEQKRIYTLSRSGTEWRGQWSEWAACGKLDPDNPFVSTTQRAGEPTGILKRAGVWSITGVRYNTEPKPMSCEDVPPAGGE